MQIHDLLEKAGKVLVIVNAQKNVEDVLKVIGILETIPYYNNLSEFLKMI